MTRKIYLAGPMRGYPLFNFPAFDAAAEKLRDRGYLVYNPAEADRARGFDPAHNHLVMEESFYMAIDLPEVCKADRVHVLPGWEGSRLARLEVFVANYLGKPVLTGDETPLSTLEIKQAIMPVIVDGNLPEPGAVLPVTSLAQAYQHAAQSSGEVRMTDPTTGAQKGVKLERYDLIPVGPLEELARVYGKGSQKYADHNWAKGYKWGWSFGALMRHAWAFWRGEEKDPETGLSHMAHCAWHCLALIDFAKNHRDKDDRFK